MTDCSIEGCGRAAYCRSWCTAHYERWRKHGHPAAEVARGQTHRYFHEVVLTYKGDDCLTWPYSRDQQGRAQFSIAGEKTRNACRIVCRRVHGEPPTPEHQAAHSCGKGHLGCVNPMHLSWKTPKENVADTLIHGTRCRGERQGNSRLTASDVREIRALRGKMFERDIAARFGISRANVSLIQLGQSWGWLDPHLIPKYVPQEPRAEFCSIAGCTRGHHAQTFCQTHYSRFRAHGDPLFLARGEENVAGGRVHD